VTFIIEDNISLNGCVSLKLYSNMLSQDAFLMKMKCWIWWANGTGQKISARSLMLVMSVCADMN